MRFIPQTMFGRTLAILISVILLIQVLGGIVHYREWQNFSENMENSQLIERLATYVQWMNAASPLQREILLRSNRFSGLRGWQSVEPSVEKVDDWFGIEALVRTRLSEALGLSDKTRIRVDDDPAKADLSGLATRDHDHHKYREGPSNRYKLSMLVAVRLDDGAWLNMKVPYRGLGKPAFPPFVVPFIVMTIIVAVLAYVIMRRANKPLAQMAQAAERLGRDVNAPPLDEEGPKEVRDAARAFNEMQTSLSRFVQDRTNMLAAISHDLRTPITRMRLRAEFVEDDQQREKMLSDLDEMESMIKATMSFARDDVANEAVTNVDLAALVESLCEDFSDTGAKVSYKGLDELSFKGRPIGLKRAVTNLINNALKYAGDCEVSLYQQAENAVISIKDKGPGIEEEKLEEVFRPFRRLEASRNKETGGVGLGLAVVRSVAHAHGGTAELLNRKEGGLEARLTLPL